MASEQFSLCWDNFHKNMSSGMNSLLENEDLVDVTLAVEGKLLKAHKMVLSVCSPYFKELFKSNPCQHPIVFMKDVSYVAISDLLQFMYQGEVQVSQDNLTTFIKTAEALQIKGLTGDGNDSNNADSEPASEKPSPRHVEEYKPAPRPKKQLPAPVVTTTPAPKRPRLSVSSNDSQSAPAPITKTEPVTAPASGSDSVQFKVEPYDQNQAVTIPDDNDDNFGDDTLDDNLADDNEDYSMMEGEEPQAGTSTDGTGEGQDNALLYSMNQTVNLDSPNNKFNIVVNDNTVVGKKSTAIPDDKFQTLMDIVLENRSMLQMLLQKINSLDFNRVKNTPGDEKVRNLLPLKNMDELLAFETQLSSDKQLEQQLHFRLSSVGGVDGKHFVRRAMSSIMTDELGTFCSLTGQKENFRVKDLKLLDVLKQAAQEQFSRLDDRLFDTVVGDWLRYSKARLTRKTR